jgi:hypothetical protein
VSLAGLAVGAPAAGIDGAGRRYKKAENTRRLLRGRLHLRNRNPPLKNSDGIHLFIDLA